jgi:predicted Abi (CAAX) family protease
MVNPNYLRAFVIGSSSIVVLPFYYIVSHFNKQKFNYNYISYTFLAPIFLGLMNVLSLFISETYNLSQRMRFLVISILASTVVMLSIILFKVYNYTMNEWVRHIIKLYLVYFLMWNIVVYNLDKYV